jgi:hypothetical protein
MRLGLRTHQFLRFALPRPAGVGVAGAGIMLARSPARDGPPGSVAALVLVSLLAGVGTTLLARAGFRRITVLCEKCGGRARSHIAKKPRLYFCADCGQDVRSEYDPTRTVAGLILLGVGHRLFERVAHRSPEIKAWPWHELTGMLLACGIGLAIVLASFAAEDAPFPSGRGPAFLAGLVFVLFGMTLGLPPLIRGSASEVVTGVLAACLVSVFCAVPVLLAGRDGAVPLVTSAVLLGTVSIAAWDRVLRRFIERRRVRFPLYAAAAVALVFVVPQAHGRFADAGSQPVFEPVDLVLESEEATAGADNGIQRVVPEPELPTRRILLLALAALPAVAGDKLVLAGFPPSDPFHAAAAAIAKHQDGAPILVFDPDDPARALPELRKRAPRSVTIVLRPEQIDVNSVRKILAAATQVDDDPFVDFEFGYVTGATAADAKAFVENIVLASRVQRPRRIGYGAVWGVKRSSAADEEEVLGSLTFAKRRLAFAGEGERDQAFLDAEMKTLAGCGAIEMGGHGMPWEIGHGPVKVN